MNRLLVGAAIALIVVGNARTQAVELLTSGDFEVPQNQPEVIGWNLEEFGTPGASGSGPITNTAVISTNGPETGPRDLGLLPFNGHAVQDPNDGNFEDDNYPGGDVDGFDFLVWQRGGSPTPNSQADLNTWEANYGRVGGQFAHAILSQTVPGVAGETYTFSGFARWEPNYAGGAGTLDAGSPFGAVATPTTNAFKMEFLDSGGGVIGTQSLDLLSDGQVNVDVWQQHTLPSTMAPVGTVNIRVTADARDMVFNVDPAQAAFYDTFSLTGAGDPNAQLLTNAGLDQAPATALEFWNLFEIPTGCCGGDVLRSNAGQGFANHTPGGNRGVWLSAFFGAHPVFEAVPVTGLMSQSVPAVAGESYSFSGWAKFEQNYSGGVDTISAASGGFFAGLTSPTETLIVVEFLDPNGVVLNPIIDFDPGGVTVLDPNSPYIIDVRAERQAQCAGNANDETCGPGSDGWTLHSLSNVIAPAGTASARLTAGMLNGVFNIDPRQSAFFDDFSLIGPGPLVAAAGVVPEPATAMGMVLGTLLLSLTRSRRRTVR